MKVQKGFIFPNSWLKIFLIYLRRMEDLFNDLVDYISDLIAGLVAFILIYLLIGLSVYLLTNVLRKALAAFGVESHTLNGMSKKEGILYSPYVLFYVIAPIGGIYCLYKMFTI